MTVSCVVLQSLQLAGPQHLVSAGQGGPNMGPTGLITNIARLPKHFKEAFQHVRSLQRVQDGQVCAYSDDVPKSAAVYGMVHLPAGLKLL